MKVENNRGLSFRDAGDRREFLSILARVAGRERLHCDAYCLMRNHFHLVVETPDANLVAGMRWLLSAYTIRFNHRHNLTGHVFSGRYKALIVEGGGSGYLKTVCDYVHLNPVRARLLGTEERLNAITQLARDAGVELPARAPRQYSPMTWDALRAAEQGGMEFGPHTVTHPILAQAPAEQAAAEVAQSWTRLRQQATNPVPVFCYPNGQFSDFGAREIQVVKQAGMQGAVSGEPGYFDRDEIRRDADEGFRVRRFAFPDDMTDVIQYVSGIERMKQLLRGQR